MATARRLSKQSGEQNAKELRNFGDEDMKEFLNVLKKETWRRHLHLRRCAIPKSALIILRDGINKNNITASVLDLSECILRGNLMLHVGEIVRAAGIRRLILRECDINEDALSLFIEGIMEFATSTPCQLKYIDLRGNYELDQEAASQQLHVLMVVSLVTTIKLNAFTIKRDEQRNMERAMSLSAGMSYISWDTFVIFTETCQIERFIIKKMSFANDANSLTHHVLSSGLVKADKVTVHLANPDKFVYEFAVGVIRALKVREVLLCNIKDKSQTDQALTEIKKQLQTTNPSTPFELRTELYKMSKDSWMLVLDIMMACHVKALEVLFEPGNMSFTEAFVCHRYSVETLTIISDSDNNFESVLVVAWQVLPFVTKELIFKNFHLTMDKSLLTTLVQRFYGRRYVVETCTDAEIKISGRGSETTQLKTRISSQKDPCFYSGSVSESMEIWDDSIKKMESLTISTDTESPASPEYQLKAVSQYSRRTYVGKIDSTVQRMRLRQWSDNSSMTVSSMDDIYSAEENKSCRPTVDTGELKSCKPHRPNVIYMDTPVFQKACKTFSGKMTYFNTIDLSGMKLEEDNTLKLAAIIAFSRQLKVVILTNCGLNDSTVTEVTRALDRHNKMMVLVDLSNNPDLKEVGCRAIACLLEKLHIQKLKVIGCGLEKWHRDIFSPSLARMPMKAGHSATIHYAENRVEYTVTEQGGTLEMANYGCSINFPPSCVDAPKVLSFAVKYPDSGTDWEKIPVTPMLQCFPCGTTFLKHFKIRLRTWMRPNSRQENSVKLRFDILTRESEDTPWSCMVKDYEHKRMDFVEFEADHFSDFKAEMNVNQVQQAEAAYCNMLFVPQADPPKHRNQTLTSCIVPNNAAFKDEKKRQALENGMILYFGGETNINVVAGDNLRLDIHHFRDDPNTTPISIMPPPPAQLPGASVLENLEVRRSFVIQLLNRGDPNVESTANVCHKFAKNDHVLTEDPHTLRWRPHNETQEIQQHVHYNVYNMRNCNVQINAEGDNNDAPAEVVQQLATVVQPGPYEGADQEGAGQQDQQ